MRVEHIEAGSPWPKGYGNHAVSGMMPGEVRDVPDVVAAYMVGVHPLHFRLVVEPVKVRKSKPDPVPEPVPVKPSEE